MIGVATRRVLLLTVFSYVMLKRGEAIVLLFPEEMSRYEVDNVKQCQRMCWYRTLCTAYSFSDASTENCVLHSTHVEDLQNVPSYPAGWVRTDLNPTNEGAGQPTNACSIRPCTDTEVCVPHPGGHKCLPLPALCSSSQSPVQNASVVGQGYLQGDSATVVCDDGFQLSPNSSSGEIFCQLNGEWTGLMTPCLQVEWANPQVMGPFVADLHWSVGPGWGMCFKGMTPADRLFFNFLPVGADPPNVFYDILLHLDLRYYISEAGYDSVSNGAYDGYTALGYIPSAIGDNFAVSFQLLDSVTLSVHMLFGDANTAIHYVIPVTSSGAGGGSRRGTGGAVDVSDAVMIWVGNEVQLTYANVVSNCTAAQFVAN